MSDTPAEVAGLVRALESWSEQGVRAADWRICWTWSRGADVGVRDSDPAGVHAPLTLEEGLSLECLIQWSDGRVSSRMGQRAELQQPAGFLGRARGAAYEDPDAACFSGAATAPEIPLFVPETAAVADGGIEPLAAVIRCARQRARAHGFSNVSGSVSAAHRRGGVLTSRGCDLRAEATLFSTGFWFEGRAGDSLARRAVIPAGEVEERLEEACGLTHRLLSTERGFGGGRLPVLLHPRVAEGMLSAYIFSNLWGERIWNGQSAFRIEQFRDGLPVARRDLELRLEPHVPLEAGSFRFTSEGVPSRPAAYLREGRLASPALDLKYARRFGMDPVPMPPSMRSVVFACQGELSRDAALEQIDRGLLVLGVLGLHTQDTTSGAFSLSASQSLAVRSGALGSGVRAGLSGNLFEALRSEELRLVRFPGQHTAGLLFPAAVTPD